jgi:hypothetical protein
VAVSAKRYRTAKEWRFWPRNASDADLFPHAFLQCCVSKVTGQLQMKLMNAVEITFEKQRLNGSAPVVAAFDSRSSCGGGERSQKLPRAGRG